MTLHGRRITSVVRTLLDLAAILNEGQLRSAFNQADRLGLLRKKVLLEFYNRPGSWKGMRRFRRLVETRHPETRTNDSELETMFMDLCRESGLPLPESNRAVNRFRPDFRWENARLIVEVDGYEFHRGRMAFENDKRRENNLRLAGYQVIRFSYDMVKYNPADVAKLVLRELIRGK